jgi:hypothetical protein
LSKARIKPSLNPCYRKASLATFKMVGSKCFCRLLRLRILVLLVKLLELFTLPALSVAIVQLFFFLGDNKLTVTYRSSGTPLRVWVSPFCCGCCWSYCCWWCHCCHCCCWCDSCQQRVDYHHHFNNQNQRYPLYCCFLQPADADLQPLCVAVVVVFVFVVVFAVLVDSSVWPMLLLRFLFFAKFVIPYKLEFFNAKSTTVW